MYRTLNCVKLVSYAHLYNDSLRKWTILRHSSAGVKPVARYKYCSACTPPFKTPGWEHKSRQRHTRQAIPSPHKHSSIATWIGWGVFTGSLLHSHCSEHSLTGPKVSLPAAGGVSGQKPGPLKFWACRRPGGLIWCLLVIFILVLIILIFILLAASSLHPCTTTSDCGS